MVEHAYAALLGTSAAMARLRGWLPKVARSDASVLITGETGTGKERVAHTIHSGSARADRPFVAINCATIPDSLFESELFGFERGAFTGAAIAHPGKLRIAHGGTVFLDEIGELSPYAQSKLLRVLESCEFFPLGATKTVTVDVRVITATSRPLELLVAERGFRSDLFYRLNVARIELPPLKERKEDIIVFLTHYLKEFGIKKARLPPVPTPEFLECLLAHDWPGNVRELRNLVESVFIDPPERSLGLDDLPEYFRAIFGRYRSVESSERDRILKALAATDWNVSHAAASLSWSRMTLYRKLAKYDIAKNL